MEQRILRTSDGEWVKCTLQEFQHNNPKNFMYSINYETNITTYYKRIK